MGLGRAVGLRGRALRRLRLAAELPDVGKILIGSDLLRKPGPLDADERRRMEQHAALSGELVGEVFPALAAIGQPPDAGAAVWGAGLPAGRSAGAGQGVGAGSGGTC